MPDGGDAEAALTADYNAEMIEQRARFPRLRDRSIFVGNPDDVVADAVRAGPAEHPRRGPRSNFDFAGYVPAVPTPSSRRPRGAAAPSSGYVPTQQRLRGDGRRVRGRRRRCCVGSSTRCRRPPRWMPGLRFVVVTGPRIDPASLAAPPRRAQCAASCPTCTGYLAACDVAVVQGGSDARAWSSRPRGDPFVYVPLRAPLRAETSRPAPPRALRRRPRAAQRPTPTGRRRRHRRARRAGSAGRADAGGHPASESKRLRELYRPLRRGAEARSRPGSRPIGIPLARCEVRDAVGDPTVGEEPGAMTNRWRRAARRMSAASAERSGAARWRRRWWRSTVCAGTR